MRVAKRGELGRVLAMVGVVLPLGLVVTPQPVWSQQPTALDKLRASDTTGKVKEPELDRARLKIAEPPPIGPSTERPALKTAGTVQNAVRRAESTALRTEFNQRLRELESCRGNGKAGQIQLRLTVLPDGRAVNTLVLEQQATDMDVMKCARKRLEGWRFTPPAEGPIDIESSYSFVRPDRASVEVAAVDTEKKPTEIKGSEAKQSEVKQPEARPTETKPTEARLTEAKGTETKPTEAKAIEGENPEGKSRAGEGKLNEARSIDEGK